MSDAEYTYAVDRGQYGNFADDSAGYGLAQWTYWSRREALYKYAKFRGKSIGDMGMQLEFFWEEIQGYQSIMDVLKKACSVEEASNAVLHGCEKPGDQSRAVENAEKKAANH